VRRLWVQVSGAALRNTCRKFLHLPITYILWCLVRMMRKLQGVARFWMENWNGTHGIDGLRAIDGGEVLEIERQQGTARSPMPLNGSSRPLQ
jgi:hypothetical protein